jgi:signal recognition particle subunit SRP14
MFCLSARYGHSAHSAIRSPTASLISPSPQFFTSLTELLSKTSQKSRGSVFLTQKPLLDGVTSGQPAILIRASNGNTDAKRPTDKDGKIDKTKASKASKVKFSTVVPADELEAFYTRYADVCKAGMTGLKKRDRSKRKAKGKVASKAAKA